MLDFQFDEFFWVAKARLPSWAGYQTRNGPYGAISSESASDGSVRITFAPEGRNKSPLTDEEVASVQWLLDHEDDMASAVLDSLFAEYPGLQQSYGYEEAERRRCMPDIASPAGFRQLIGLHTVHVHPLRKNGLAYIGFEFGCTWDDEHGLGVLMHGTRVVQVGGADTAFLLWIARQDAEAR